MSKYEITSLIISIIALIISTVSIVRARKIQASFLELEKVHAELSRKQLEELNCAENLRNKANLNVTIYNGSLLIKNIGIAKASNIEVYFDDIEFDCILLSEKNKLPYPVLNASEEFKLVASYHTKNAPQLVPIKLKWKNMDDSPGEYNCVIQP